MSAMTVHDSCIKVYQITGSFKRHHICGWALSICQANEEGLSSLLCQLDDKHENSDADLQSLKGSSPCLAGNEKQQGQKSKTYLDFG